MPSVRDIQVGADCCRVDVFCVPVQHAKACRATCDVGKMDQVKIEEK
jgi:hypothetical protein